MPYSLEFHLLQFSASSYILINRKNIPTISILFFILLLCLRIKKFMFHTVLYDYTVYTDDQMIFIYLYFSIYYIFDD